MEIEARLAERVRQVRQKRGWSQEKLADRAGLHRTFISQVERAVKRTTIRSLEKIVKALDITFGDLLD